MNTKTWNLTLTPVDGTVEHVDGLSKADTLAVIRQIIGGVSAADIAELHQSAPARTAQPAPALALAA